MTYRWRHRMPVQRSFTSAVSVSACQEYRHFDCGVLLDLTAVRSWSESSRSSTACLRQTRRVDIVHRLVTVSSWLTCRPAFNAVDAITARSMSATRTWWVVVLTPSTCRSTTPVYPVSSVIVLPVAQALPMHITTRHSSHCTVQTWESTWGRLERSKSAQVTFVYRQVGFVWHRLFRVKSTSRRKICVMYLM